MPKHILSKSTFIKGDQCLKQLYLYKNRYFLRDKMPRERIEKFKRGTNIGIMAQELFPGGIDVKPKSPSQYQKAILRTQEEIERGANTIYEATFQYDGVLIMLDILHKDHEGWKAYEVKSSKSISKTYVKDAALQFYVISNSGIELNDFQLIHINPDYIMDGELDIHKLFKHVSVLEECKQHNEYIQTKILEEKEAIQLKSSPPIPVGKHCFSPYSCDFIGHCWKKQSKDSIFQLMDSSLEERQKLLDKGIESISQIPQDYAFTPMQKSQFMAISQKSEFIDPHAISANLKFHPLAVYMDILYYQHTLPFFKNTSPYESIPVSITATDGVNKYFKIFKDHPKEEIKKHFTDCLSRNEQIVLWSRQIAKLILGETKTQSIPSDKIIYIKDIFEKGWYFHPKLRTIDPVNIANYILKEKKITAINSDELALYQLYDYFNSENEREKNIEILEEYSDWKLNIMSQFYLYLQEKVKNS